MAQRKPLIRVWNDNIPNLIQEKINEGWSLQLAMKKANVDSKLTASWKQQHPEFLSLVNDYKSKVRHRQKFRVNGR